MGFRSFSVAKLVYNVLKGIDLTPAVARVDHNVPILVFLRRTAYRHYHSSIVGIICNCFTFNNFSWFRLSGDLNFLNHPSYVRIVYVFLILRALIKLLRLV